MQKADARQNSHKSMALLSCVLLQPRSEGSSAAENLTSELFSINNDGFRDLESLACTNHVIVRAMRAIRTLIAEDDHARVGWVEDALAREEARIANAQLFLHAICKEFSANGKAVAVIKSLDHWPDLGSDLDLYTDADPAEVIGLMVGRFDAKIAPQSWGDRLAGKWNFAVPGLRELVEIHIGRLGQTGEQFAIASSLLRRTQEVTIGNFGFRVPSISDRLIISAMQRMYRHFYFRLCDIVDSATLCESGKIDYEDLRSAANAGGIWEGVATYLVIVSDYVMRWRGTDLNLPAEVRHAARFRGDQLYFAKDFLRIPILPQSATLYGVQLARVFGKRQLLSGARLSLLPWLATAALVGQKTTGSDKGIW